MSFREKSLWVSFVLMFGFFGYYFWFISQVSAGNADQDSTLHVFLIVLIGLIVGELSARAIFRVRNPKEATAPRDERERQIELRARGIAYYVLMVAALLTIASAHVSADGYYLAQHVLMALVIAELTRLGVQIKAFRRDAA